jgi:hypothetical protein
MRKPFVFVLLTLLAVVLSCTDQEKTRCDIALELEGKDYENHWVDIALGIPPTMKTFIIHSIPKNPGAVLSSLQDVEVSYFYADWVRSDGGTIPPKDYRLGWTVLVPAGGSATCTGIPFMRLGQLVEPPFIDLLPENGGRDSETGATTIRCDAHIKVYGRTMNGCDVVSHEAILTYEFYYGGGK